MKASDLIARLQSLDPDTVIYIDNPTGDYIGTVEVFPISRVGVETVRRKCGDGVLITCDRCDRDGNEREDVTEVFIIS